MFVAVRFFFALSLFASVVAACSTETSSDGTRGPSGSTYRDPGPWAAGVTTLTLADREVEVWYPADPADTNGLEPAPYFIRDELSDPLESLLPEDLNPPFITDAFRDAPPSLAGPFPLVLFSHGSPAYRNQSTFLTTHLASWGFVVAAVDHLERGLRFIASFEPPPDMDDTELSRMVVMLLASENERDGGLLEGRVSTERIAITGHSAGGGTSFRFGAEPDVVTYIPLSSGVFQQQPTELPDKPSLWLTGTIDGIIEPQRTIEAFNQATAPTRLVLIDDMGHLGPSDICVIGEGGGGVIALAREADLPVEELGLDRLGADGCQEEALTIEDGWPVVRHFVTAQLRWAFGIDEEPLGLSQDVQRFFPEATFAYDESL